MKKIKKVRSLACAVALLALCLGGVRTHSADDKTTPTQSKDEKSLARNIESIKQMGLEFQGVRLFQGEGQSVLRMAAPAGSAEEALQRELNDATVLPLNKKAVRKVLENQFGLINLALPAEGRSVELELVKVDLFSSDFSVVTNTSKGEPVAYDQGVHYRGIVKGDPNSVAAISVFRNEVMGMYSTGEGNFILAKMGGPNPDNNHILYAENDVRSRPQLSCDTGDPSFGAGVTELRESESVNLQSVRAKRIRVYEEVDYSLYRGKGESVVEVANYISGHFNQVAAIYANAGIRLSLSQVFVWDSPSPYEGTREQQLRRFQANLNSFNGDIGQLVSAHDSFAGVAMQPSSLCNSTPSERLSLVEVASAGALVPMDSFAVQIMSHQMGHLFGSAPDLGMNLSDGFGKQFSSLMQGKIGNAPCFNALPGLPQVPDHVLFVIEENKSFNQIIGSSSAPYINSLANQGALFTQSFGVTHPSQPNYIALFSGSTQGITDDSCPHTFSAANLGSELIAAGLTFRGFSEDLPSVGSTVCQSGSYVRKHNPWVDFSNVPSSSNQPFTSFPTDLTNLPTVSFVIPNQANDMHDGSISTGDTWLRDHIDPYVQFAKTHNSLLILTWDEDDFTTVNQIATVFVGPMVKRGQFNERINHFNVLRTILDMYGLPLIANATNATPITDVWQGVSVNPDFSITASPSSLSVAQGGNRTSTITVTSSNGFNGATSLSVSGLPSGVTASFSPSSVTPPANGSASSTLTLTASSTAATGTFNVSVTGTSGSLSHSATVSLTVTSSGSGGELIVNGGFEGSISPWTPSGSAQRSTGSFPHSGTGYLIVVFGNNQTGAAFQQISIPSGTSPNLTFWLNVTSSETTTTTQFDRLFIEVRSTSGALLSRLATFSNLNKSTAGNYAQRGSFSLSSFAGQTVRIQFRAVNDNTLSTTFRVDDVSVR
jgi:phosphatidylinositol-3-phosphatase